MIPFLIFPNEITFLLICYFFALLFFTLIFVPLNKLKPSNLTKNLKERVFSWWIIFICYLIFLGINKEISFIGFCLCSFIAHRELVSNLSFPIDSRRIVLWSYLAIPVQYYIAYTGKLIPFLVFLPLGMLFLISLRNILEDKPEFSLKVFTELYWSLMLTTFTISHIPYILNLPTSPAEQNAPQALIFFLIFITASNDIFQYTFGKLFGRKKVFPQTSPNKTLAGIIGGVVGSLALAYLFKDIMPLSQKQTLLLGAIISLSGFLGDMNISSLKRNLNVKDMSNFIPGHGGVLDRLDSLCFSSIAFFYTIYSWIYA
jgi:phosphatidate cytidylyltransferase